jgi:spermidine synthase
VTHFALYAVVAISGAAVLAIEILGTRILGPFYGVSIFLWSALIAVTLAALAAGYALGGRWADRGPRMSRLGTLLAVAGAWTLLVPWLRQPLLALLEPLGLRAAVLAAAFVLFAPPLLCLGMVSPYAIRLKADRLDAVGRTAGNLYAISTLASVLSALATGFYLVPLVGVVRLLLLIGFLLLAGAGLAFAADRRGRAGMVAALVVAALGAVSWSATAAAPEDGLRARIDTPYAEIRVLDRNHIRYLLLDGGVHTAMQPDTWAPSQRYVPALAVARHFFARPGRLLLVGLGGGSVVKDYARAGWNIETVEIDPGVVRMAREHFELGDHADRVVCMDGRRFLRETTSSYDLIVLDAFGSSSIPFHLVTREMFALAASRLAADGILALNIETRSWDDPLLGAIAATVQTSLPHLAALPTSEPQNTLGNVILLAASRSLELADDTLPHPREFLHEPELHWQIVQQNHAWDNRYQPRTDGLPVLTDDRNRVELWAEEVNRIARRSLHEFFGRDGLSW